MAVNKKVRIWLGLGWGCVTLMIKGMKGNDGMMRRHGSNGGWGCWKWLAWRLGIRMCSAVKFWSRVGFDK